MQNNEFYIQGGSGHQLFLKSWTPATEPEAVVAIMHGLGDHINRYGDFAGYLTSHGIAVIGIDLPGHGRSSGKRGHISGYPWTIDVVQQLMLETRRRFNDIPIIIYGHSLGGNFVLRYVLHHTSKEIKGVIASSPWLHPTITWAQWKDFFIRFAGKIFPYFVLPLDLDPMELSRDPATRKNFLEDGLVHDRISIRLYRDLYKSSRWILENVKRMPYPILIMHGREDRITSVHASVELADKIPSGVNLKIWEGMRHELHHEKSKLQVWDYIISWIKGILDKTG